MHNVSVSGGDGIRYIAYKLKNIQPKIVSIGHAWRIYRTFRRFISEFYLKLQPCLRRNYIDVLIFINTHCVFLYANYM